MGVVKRDIHKNEHKFKLISFSDPDCIKGLIIHRSTVDDYYDFSNEEVDKIIELSIYIANKELMKRENKILRIRETSTDKWENFISASHITETNQELIGLYADLDRLIEDASLSKKQLIIVKMLMCGLNHNDVGFYFKQDGRLVKETLDNICNKLSIEYKKKWKYSLAEQDCIRVLWSYKQCTKCNNTLPVTPDYFGNDTRNKDGFKSICKKCDNYTKKTVK